MVRLDSKAANEPTRAAAPVIKRVETGALGDAYSVLLALPLWALAGAVFVLFLLTNLMFALLYLLGAANWQQVQGPLDAFFLSVQTIAGVDLGYAAPTSLYAKALMTVEAFVGLLALALGTGLFFARISRPSSRVVFTRKALITRFEGRPTLMIRTGNRRGNQIFDAQATLNLARDGCTPDGHVIRRFVDLPMVKSRAPLFAFTWTLMHTIDDASPLSGATAETLRAENAEVLVVMGGVDDRFGQPVYARCSYTAEEIDFGGRFADVLSQDTDGRWRMDYSRFHDLVEAG